MCVCVCVVHVFVGPLPNNQKYIDKIDCQLWDVYGRSHCQLIMTGVMGQQISCKILIGGVFDCVSHAPRP